jgi:hypothetical protein
LEKENAPTGQSLLLAGFVKWGKKWFQKTLKSGIIQAGEKHEKNQTASNTQSNGGSIRPSWKEA